MNFDSTWSPPAENFENRWLQALYRKDGRFYRTIAVVTSPAVIVEDLESGDRTTLVIGSPRHGEYEELVPKEMPA